MDLRPYGLDLTWTSETEIRTLDPSILASAHLYKDSGFVIAGRTYRAVQKINQGTFGIIYKVKHAGKFYACKVLRDMKTNGDFQSFLNEVLIHILLLQASMNQPNGPYVSYLYKVAFDKAAQKAYILTEWMDRTLREDILAHTKAENDARLPTLLAQIAHMLSFFGRELRFNHRDLHTGNVMVGSHLRRVVLIDFGYSCLSALGSEFKGPSIYNGEQNPCYKPDRDIPFLLMELYMLYEAYIGEALRQTIHAELIAHIGDATCDMGTLCPDHDLASLDDRYLFLNKPSVRVESGSTEKAEQQFRHFRPRNTKPRTKTRKHRHRHRKAMLRPNHNRRTIRHIPKNMKLEKGVVGPLE
jgi:serine/threonine protein kinase